MQAKVYMPTVATPQPPGTALFVLPAQAMAAGPVTGVVVGSSSLAVAFMSASKTVSGLEGSPPANPPITATDSQFNRCTS